MHWNRATRHTSQAAAATTSARGRASIRVLLKKISTKKWMKEWTDVMTEHLPVLPVCVWDKPVSPRGWTTDELPISIIHVNPVGHPFMWWSGIVPLNRRLQRRSERLRRAEINFMSEGAGLPGNVRRNTSRLGLSRTSLHLPEDVIFSGFTAGVLPYAVCVCTRAPGL